MTLRRIIPILIALLIAPLAVNAQPFQDLHEYGNAVDANALSGAGVARGTTYDAATDVYTITAGGTDIWSNSDHGTAIFNDAGTAVTDDFSAVVKIQIGLPGEVMPTEWGRSGIMARTDPADAASAYFASTQKFSGPNQNVLQARDSLGAGTGRPSDGSATTLVTGENADVPAVPVWLALHRFNGGIYATWAPDAGGSPGAWSAAEARAGSADHLGPVQMGLFHQNHNVQPETSTATFMNYEQGAFNNALGDFPSVITRPDQLVLNAEGKVTGDMFGTEIGGGEKQAVEWKVELLGEATITEGLFARSYARANDAPRPFNPNSADPLGAGPLGNISWWGNGTPPDGSGLEKYPAVFNLPSPDDNDNYTVDTQGQIFIPEPGTYKFKDGVDDYTYLQIDGEVLIDDNDWTGPTGSDNGGSPIVEKTFGAGEDGWVDFRFQMAEGGGGDSGVLYWDHDNTEFPATNTDAAGVGAIVPAENFRTLTFAVDDMISNTSVQEGVLMGEDGVMVSWEVGRMARVTVNGTPQTVNIVPEPNSIALCLMGALGLLNVRRRRR